MLKIKTILFVAVFALLASLSGCMTNTTNTPNATGPGNHTPDNTLAPTDILPDNSPDTTPYGTDNPADPRSNPYNGTLPDNGNELPYQTENPGNNTNPYSRTMPGNDNMPYNPSVTPYGTATPEKIK